MKRFCISLMALFFSVTLPAMGWQELYEVEREALAKDWDLEALVGRLEAALPEVSAQDRPYLVAMLLLAADREGLEEKAQPYKAEVLQDVAVYAALPAEPLLTLFRQQPKYSFPGMSVLALLTECDWEPSERAQLIAAVRTTQDRIAYGLLRMRELSMCFKDSELEAAHKDPWLLGEFRAMVYLQQASSLRYEDPEKAVQYLLNGLDLARLHEVCAQLQYALNAIRQTRVNIEPDVSVLPPGVTTFTVNYRNTDRLVVRYSGCVNTTQTVKLPAPEKRYAWAKTTFETPAFPTGTVEITFIPDTMHAEDPGQSLTRTFSIQALNVTQLSETPHTFLVTDARTGCPVRGASLTIDDALGRFRAETDADGVVRILGMDSLPSRYRYTIKAQKGEACGTYDAEWLQPFVERKEEVTLLTDRRFYRPGETVHWQLFARQWTTEETVSAPFACEATLTFIGESYTGNTFEEKQQVKTSAAGTASGAFVLPKDFTGSVNVRWGKKRLYMSIPVFEYRANALRMTLEAFAETGRWEEPLTLRGTLFDLTGSPADGASVTLECRTTEKHVTTVSGTVAPDGSFTFDLQPTLPPMTEEENDVLLTVKVKAVAQNGEQLGETKQFHLLRYGYVPELVAPKWCLDGETISVALTVETSDPSEWSPFVTVETPPLVEGTLSVYQELDLPNRQLIQTHTMTSEMPISLKLPAGNYECRFVSRDQLETSRRFTVLPKTHNPTCFPSEKARLRILREDATPIRVGDTLRGFAWTRSASPAKLYIFTRKGLHAVLPLESPFFELPVTEAFAGGFFVQLLGFDATQPLMDDFCCATVEPRPLTLTMTRFQEQVLPSTEQQWALTVDDPTAEVLLTCYDAALDSIMPYSWSDFRLPRPDFYNARFVSALFRHYGLYFHEKLPSDFIERVAEEWEDDSMVEVCYEAPDSDGSWGEYTVVVQAASASEGTGIYRRRLATRLYGRYGAAMKKAPASAEEAASGATVRRNFAATALWAPQRRVTENAVTYTFTLPDTMTTWKVMAVAYTPEGRQGFLEKTCVASKPIMLKPYLPRFLRQGDTITAVLAVTNATDEAHTTWVECNGAQRQTLTLSARETQSLSWTLTAPQEGGDFTVTFTSPEDAVAHTLPLAPQKVACEEVFPITLQGTAPFTLDLSTLPQGAELDWQWETSPTSAVVEALQEVLKSECESSDSRFARIMAMILLERLTDTRYPELGKAVAELLAMRTDTATWPWFAGGRSSVSSTATIARGCAQLARINALPEPLAKAFTGVSLEASVALHAYTAKLRHEPIPEASVTAEKMTLRMREDVFRNEARMLTVAALEQGHAQLAAMGLKSIRETMSTSPTWGNWWQTRSPAWWRWLDDPLYHHALCMEALRLADDKEAVKGAALWLLQHRRFNRWGSPSSTVAAAYALVQSPLSTEPPPEIEVTRSEQAITFRRPTDGLTFGRLMARFTADPTQLQTLAPDERFPVTLTSRWHTENLKVGDTLMGEVTLQVEQDMECLVLEVPRPANTEPEVLRPQWQYNDDLFAYAVPHDTGLTLYVEALPRGKHTIPVRFRVTHAGTCTTAPLTLTPFAVPDFALYAPGIKLQVTP